ncbi:MAG: hypothetical protein SF162_14770 [bacterium]|nr:hypothetical protein [bacterium]
MTLANTISTPPPDLRILPTGALYPHETHDSQRLYPLIERLRQESVMINPPIVAPMDADEQAFVVLDGANRTSAFAQLEYPHILVQVVAYGSAHVQLETWHHVVCAWSIDDFIRHLETLEGIVLHEGGDPHGLLLASVQFRDERLIAVSTPTADPVLRNRSLVELVGVYQRHAVLHRTAFMQPADVWRLHADGIALVVFPRYRPADVIAAARERAFVPPGITRHIIQGRALRVNYPLMALRDPAASLEAKNAALNTWLAGKIDQRQMRYYAESTYQFDE